MNPKEYEDRLRMVTRLFIRGISEEEIALAVGVDQSTVSRDLDEIRKRNQERFDAKLESWQDAKTLAAEVNQKYDELEREAWDAVSNSQGTSKVAGLKEVREINEKRIHLEVVIQEEYNLRLRLHHCVIKRAQHPVVRHRDNSNGRKLAFDDRDAFVCTFVVNHEHLACVAGMFDRLDQRTDAV